MFLLGVMAISNILSAHFGSCLFHMKVGIFYDHYAEEYYDIVHYTVELFAAKAEHGNDLVIDPVEFNLDYFPNAYDEILNRDLTVVIIAGKKLSCDRLSGVKNRIPIFVVTGSFTNCDQYDDVNSMFYLYPSDDAIVNTMLMAAVKYKWKSAIVLGEKNKEFDFTFASMQQAREREIDTVAFEVTYEKAALTETLLTAKREGIRSFVLMSQMHHVDIFLSAAEEVGITDKNYHWFIPNVFVTPQTVEEFVRKGMTFTLLYSPILTPLIHKIMEKESGNASETFLMNEVVSSLTLLALELTFTACEHALEEQCLEDLGSNTTCQPNREDVSSYLESLAMSTTADAQTSSSIITISSSRRKRSIIPSSLSDNRNASRPAETCKRCGQKTYLASVCAKKHCMHSRNTKIPVSVTDEGSAAGESLARKGRAGSAYSPTAAVSPIASNPNSDCLIHHWDDSFISIAASITDTVLFHRDWLGNASLSNSSTETYVKSLSTIPQVDTILDSCAYTSKTSWAYANGTCSYKLMRNSEDRYANVLYVVEYAGADEKNRKPLVVGAFNRQNDSFIAVTYDELHLYHVYLPKEDFLIGAIYHPPWLSWEVDEATGEIAFTGYLYEVLQHLSQTMGFTYQLLPEYDFGGDLMYVDDVEKLMFSHFANNTVDFFLHAKSIRGNRLGKSDLVYLTTSFQSPSMYLLTKRVESTETVSIWQFMLPFREESWIVFWSSFILVSLLMAYFNKKNPNEYEAIAHTFGPNSSASDHLGILNSLWFNFAPICGQGVDLVPQSTACTVLTGTWWLFLLLVVSAYTANMTAFMTQVNNGGIETLDALANQKEFSYGIMEASAMYRLFLPQAKVTPFTTIWEYLQKNRAQAVFQTQEAVFEKVLEGNFIFIGDFETVVEAMATSCEFDVKGEGFYDYQFALPFPRGSVYTPIFNDQIRKLADDGILSDLEEKWFTIEKNCEAVTTESSLENQLDIKAFIGMYVFLAFGVTGGLVVCLFETGWIKYGGIQGFFGRAGIYELDADRTEIQKSNELMEKEFESWEGGWDVWKFKEWKPEDDLRLVEATNNARPASHRENCNVCGRALKGKQEPKVDEEQNLQAITLLSSPLHQKDEDGDDDSSDSGRDSASSEIFESREARDRESPIENQQRDEELENTEKTNNFTRQKLYPTLNAEKAIDAVQNPYKPTYQTVRTSNHFETVNSELMTAVCDSAVKVKEEKILPSQHPPKAKVNSQSKMASSQPNLDTAPPKFSHRLPAIPMESHYDSTEDRMGSVLSSASTFSHSSLASGTLSFLSESDDSVSTIHPRTPYELSPSPMSSYTGSTLSRDFQSSFRSDVSYYSTTSHEPESVYSRQSYWSHSMRETPISYLSELTEDALSDVTVISRRAK